MSAKWRALQHRHRYTYSAVVFPRHYVSSLDELPAELKTQRFFAELKVLVSLTSTYSQLTHSKNVASAFGELVAHGDLSSVSTAARYYTEILFLENSVPLHRALASALAKTKSIGDIIGGCFRTLCGDYCGWNENFGAKGKIFCVSRAALSMMSIPKLGYLMEVVEDCCVIVALDIVAGLNWVVGEIDGLARPSPLVMEQCQDALSCLYYLFQKFPSRFSNLGGVANGSAGGEGSSVFELALTALLSILKSLSFSRDCLVAAGVSFCAGLQVSLDSEEIGYLIIVCVFGGAKGDLAGDCKTKFANGIAKVPYTGDLCAVLRNLHALNRLCLIRGILTALHREVLNTQFSVQRNISIDNHMDGINGSSLRTILYDDILPTLCYYCENPTDSHFNFHALTVMQICLQQIKTSLLAGLIDPKAEFDPLPEEMRLQLMRIVWNNLEDPLSQTVKQVHLILDLLLDIQCTLYQGNQRKRIKPFLSKIAGDLLCLGPRCKGKYVPLASLTRRLGAKSIMEMSPRLLFETVQAYIDDDVCCAASSFLKCFLENLRDECWSSDGIGLGHELYRGHCLPPLLCGLASGVSKLRSNLCTYALPCLLDVDVDSIFPLLSFLSVEVGDDTSLVYPELCGLDLNLDIEQRVAVFISLIKVSRSLALFEGDIASCQISPSSMQSNWLQNETAFLFIKGLRVKVPIEWLVLALTHVDDSLRVDAAESLFLNPKTASLPSQLELNLMRKSVPLNMRCSSTGFQMKWTSLFKKFFGRAKTALERQIKQRIWLPNASCEEINVSNAGEPVDEKQVSQAQELFKFVKWLSCFLFFSCYPSAPYERKIMAMELIQIMINVWSIMPPLLEKPTMPCSEVYLYPYNRELTSPDSTLLLVGSMIDSWDRLRVSSFHILLSFPTPLPGISSDEMIHQVISWAKNLVCSPRVRESDAGALTLRLIFHKYVMELGWTVRISTNIICLNSVSECNLSMSAFPVVEYIKSLIDWLRDAVEEGERDLVQACQNSFVHGILLALRYTFEELDWCSDIVMASIPEMRTEFDKLLELVMRITSLALWVVSADALHLPDDMDDIADVDDVLELQTEMDVNEEDVKDSELLRNPRPTAQIVMVGCWLAMKEVSLLLGTIIRKIPLPSPALSDEPDTSVVVANSSCLVSDIVLDLKQLEAIGDHFLKVILKMKHNGAIDKTRAGLTALCNRLLCSNDPRLCHLVETWMEQLKERMITKGQTVDDLLRRSGGIPAAFSAFFLSEPEGAPKKLLLQSLRWLIDIASRSFLEQNTYVSVKILTSSENRSDSLFETDVSGKSSKMRVEGVIPIVHAFNVLRATFNDTNLATDTSGFAAEAMIAAIQSFSSPHWEVRNSAGLAYTALVRRMIGFLNVHKRESARRSITSLEFFHRYPALHSFMFNELKIATESFVDESSHSYLAQEVHPSLCPMLILLSRLKPSSVASETGDELEPFLFMPFIQRCSMLCNLRIRVLASRALTGLVSDEKLHTVVISIASQLPLSKPQSVENPVMTDSYKSSGRSNHCSLNCVHGVLLQLEALLDTNCRKLADVSMKDLILSNLLELLVKCSWIGSPRSCPCPTINSTFLRVLDNMLSIVRTSQTDKSCGSISCLLFNLSAECLSVNVLDRSSFYDPTIEELRKQASISYFGCIFQELDENTQDVNLNLSEESSSVEKGLCRKSETEHGFIKVNEVLILSLSDASYEVRVATFKWLFKLLQATKKGVFDEGQHKSEIEAIYLWAKTNLQTTLTKLLWQESNHKCGYYILRILYTWNRLQVGIGMHDIHVDVVYVGEMDYESVLDLWNQFISRYDVASHTKTKSSLICCMGLCVGRFTVLLKNMALQNGDNWKIQSSERNSNRCTILCNCISYYVGLIKQHSVSSEHVYIRTAVAESLVSSGLLEQAEYISSTVCNDKIVFQDSSCMHSEFREAVNMFAYQILEIWYTCIKLLEDEDAGLREKLALDVQRSFPCRFMSSSEVGFVPVQVEKVIELSFEFLSSVFGHWIVYFEYLSRWVLDAARFVASTGDLVRKVFDKEIDNHHEEKLLICQICLFHLEKLPVVKEWASSSNGPRRREVCELLRSWRSRFCEQLISFAGGSMGKLEGGNWLGGMGNHKDAFLPLYANLLGVYVFSKCIITLETEDAKHPIYDVVQLGKYVKPFMGNPLICNLYVLLVKLHEEVGEASAPTPHASKREVGDGELWEGFYPYFLLG